MQIVRQLSARVFLLKKLYHDKHLVKQNYVKANNIPRSSKKVRKKSFFFRVVLTEKRRHLGFYIKVTILGHYFQIF